MPEVGAIIAGKYRVDRAIGAGGMGTVVAATHLQLGTQLALKFLAEKIKDSRSSVERFSREARACAQLRGEHVCRVSDFGVDETGLPYIATELLDGSDLATRRQPPTTSCRHAWRSCSSTATATSRARTARSKSRSPSADKTDLDLLKPKGVAN